MSASPWTDGQLTADALFGKRRTRVGVGEVLSSVHDTYESSPLIEITSLFGPTPCRVLLKYEPALPSGSHKYRAARAAVTHAAVSGDLREGMRILAPTGGNYGRALATLACAIGVPCTLVLPDNYPPAKMRLLEISGAEVVLADHRRGANAHGILASEILWEDPDRHCLFDQFNDPSNVEGHRATAQEVIKALGGEPVDELVLGIGSGASLTGIASTLLAHQGRLVVTAVQPEGCDVLAGRCVADHGIPGFAVGGPPRNLDQTLVSLVVTVAPSEARLRAVDTLRRAGIDLGISSGANLAAVATRLASDARPRTILTLAYDHIDAYLDELPG